MFRLNIKVYAWPSSKPRALWVISWTNRRNEKVICWRSAYRLLKRQETSDSSEKRRKSFAWLIWDTNIHRQPNLDAIRRRSNWLQASVLHIKTDESERLCYGLSKDEWLRPFIFKSVEAVLLQFQMPASRQRRWPNWRNKPVFHARCYQGSWIRHV